VPHLVLSGQVKNKKEITEYFHALGKELGIGRMWSKVIFVSFETQLPDGAQGLCWGDKANGYVDIQIARKSQGENIDYDEMMKTLAHEMVHAKQYLRGELHGWTGSWKGKKPRNYKYENAPWEKEAHGKETELYNYCWKK